MCIENASQSPSLRLLVVHSLGSPTRIRIVIPAAIMEKINTILRNLVVPAVDEFIFNIIILEWFIFQNGRFFLLFS